MIIEKYYTVADTVLCIAADERIMYGDDGVLAPFALASVSGGVVRYEYEISDSLPDPCGTPTVSRPDIAEFGEGENTVRYIGAVANSLDGAYICTRKEGSTVRVTVKSSFCSKLSPSLILNSVSAERLAVMRAESYSIRRISDSETREYCSPRRRAPESPHRRSFGGNGAEPT